MKRSFEEFTQEVEKSSSSNQATSSQSHQVGFEIVAHPVFKSGGEGFHGPVWENGEIHCQRITRQKSKRYRHTDCPICFGPLCKPVSPDCCPHTFCFHCLHLWAERCYEVNNFPSCPICKRRMRLFVNMQGVVLNLKLFEKAPRNQNHPSEGAVGIRNQECREY
mmetsp:Transcript_3890/g.4487  ORF Transcript_3890/g.4487 Transcript_3890/m.4487 type:complete len:164 (+) Transcript_3890:306-797(+)